MNGKRKTSKGRFVHSAADEQGDARRCRIAALSCPILAAVTKSRPVVTCLLSIPRHGALIVGAVGELLDISARGVLPVCKRGRTTKLSFSPSLWTTPSPSIVQLAYIRGIRKASGPLVITFMHASEALTSR